jgi:hypothetical protein
MLRSVFENNTSPATALQLADQTIHAALLRLQATGAPAATPSPAP